MATTLLEQVNDVLTLLNEQTVASVEDTTVSLKVKLVLEQALRKLVTLSNQWPWLRTSLTSTQWVVDRALLDTSVIDVFFIRYNNSYLIKYVQPRQYFLQEAIAGEPVCYTIVGEDYYFRPYPDTVERQQKVVFHVAKYPTPPQADTEEYTLPDEFLPVMRYIAMSELAVSHLSDAGMARHYRQAEVEMLQTLRAKRFNSPVSEQTMIADFEGTSW